MNTIFWLTFGFLSIFAIPSIYYALKLRKEKKAEQAARDADIDAKASWRSTEQEAIRRVAQNMKNIVHQQEQIKKRSEATESLLTDVSLVTPKIKMVDKQGG